MSYAAYDKPWLVPGRSSCSCVCARALALSLLFCSLVMLLDWVWIGYGTKSNPSNKVKGTYPTDPIDIHY